MHIPGRMARSTRGIPRLHPPLQGVGYLLRPVVWHRGGMGIDFVALAVCIGLTLLGLLITAIIWSRAKWKTIVWWLGASMAPIAIFLLGLVPYLIRGYWALVEWSTALTFNMMEVFGVGFGTVAVGMMLISRAIPAKPRVRKVAPETPTAPLASGRAVSAVAPVDPTARMPASQATPGDDLDEITEILRRRGIE